MILLIRRSLAVVSACGVAASIAVYVASYFGATMDGNFQWAVVLSIGMLVLLLPIFAFEYSTIKKRTFFWNGFMQGQPKWVVPSINGLGLFFAIHFVLFLFMSHAASPEIQNGAYVLNNHGKIVKVLTQSEYLTLKGAELRIFATSGMFFYFVPTMYWWFPRNRQQVT